MKLPAEFNDRACINRVGADITITDDRTGNPERQRHAAAVDHPIKDACRYSGDGEHLLSRKESSQETILHCMSHHTHFGWLAKSEIRLEGIEVVNRQAGGTRRPNEPLHDGGPATGGTSTTSSLMPSRTNHNVEVLGTGFVARKLVHRYKEFYGDPSDLIPRIALACAKAVYHPGMTTKQWMHDALESFATTWAISR